MIDAATPVAVDKGCFEVYDTPQRIATMYPVVATVGEPERESGSYRVSGVRFRSDAELTEFCEQYPTFEVTRGDGA